MDDSPEGHWAAFEDMLPEGAVAIHGWRVVEYIPEDGEDSKLFMTVHGEPSLIETCGALTIGQYLAQFTSFADPHSQEGVETPDEPSN